jgi:endoribonuclease LACTB2
VSFRDSAAVVLVRGHGGSLEVFWVRRSDRVSYMPGFHAFLGGVVDREDSTVTFEDLSDRADPLRACAIREAFEEAGVLVALDPTSAGARAVAGASPSAVATESNTLAEARRRLLAGETSFRSLAREHSWRFRAGGLVYAGRWTTPVFSAARFDTTYYLAWVPEGQEPEVREGELESGEWIAPRDAIERWKQGDATFAAPILYTLEELAQGEDDLAERLAMAPENAGRPVRRIELKWGIVLHPMKTRPLPPATHTNAYLVGEREMVLIDPGSGDPDEIEELSRLIEALGQDGRRLKLILLTHHHPDHVGGVEAVRARYRVPVGAHRETASHVGADLMLKDGDEIQLASGTGDWTLRAIHTPGHARGHLCFFHPRTGSLFTGDHITGGGGTVIIDPPEGDMAAYVASLERLLKEPIGTLFPGHGSPQGAAARRINWLITHRREREAKVLAALTGNAEPLSALVARAYADTPHELWGYAERSLLAHLLKLESEGRAHREGDRWRIS